MELVQEIYLLTSLLPSDERFGLTSQMRRAAVSIPSNIAEGKTRGTLKDYRRFIYQAFGSGGELETQLEICLRLNFLDEVKARKAFSLLLEVMKMLNKLIQKLDDRPHSFTQPPSALTP